METAQLEKKKLKKGRIALRPASADDRAFLLQVYASGREIELSMVPWSDAEKEAFVNHQFDAQTAYYLEKFPEAKHDIILLDGEPAGRLYVHRSPELISILDLTVLPRSRKQGVGTFVIESLIDEASSSDRPLGVYVENFNPSQMLFKGLGFAVRSEDEMNLYLVWGPAQD